MIIGYYICNEATKLFLIKSAPIHSCTVSGSILPATFVMMYLMSEAKQQSKQIREEANRLLESTKLEALLSQFGEVELGGSYAYDLMVDRDLDFGVAVESITPEIRSKIASLFASQSWAYGVKMTDRVTLSRCPIWEHHADFI